MNVRLFTIVTAGLAAAALPASAIDLGAKYAGNRAGFDHGMRATASELAYLADAPGVAEPRFLECEYSAFRSGKQGFFHHGARKELFIHRHVFAALKTVADDENALRLVLADKLVAPASDPANASGGFLAMGLSDGEFGLAGYDRKHSVIVRKGTSDDALYIRIHPYREERRHHVDEHKIYVRCAIPTPDQCPGPVDPQPEPTPEPTPDPEPTPTPSPTPIDVIVH